MRKLLSLFTSAFSSRSHQPLALRNFRPIREHQYPGYDLSANIAALGDQQWSSGAQAAKATDRSVTISLANFAPGIYALDFSSFSLATQS